MSLIHGASLVRDGLILHLDAANNKSYPGTGGTWFDLTSTTNATLANVTITEPEYISFSASSSKATITPYVTGSLTANVWYRRNDAQSSTSWRTLLATAGTNIHQLILNQTTRSLGVWDGGFKNLGYIPLEDGLFHNIVVVYRSAVSATLFVDGIFHSTVATTLDLRTSPIGTIANWSGNSYWAGQISSCSLYNRELSAAEIKHNFEAFRGRYGV